MINQIVNGQDCLKLLFWWKIAFGSVATSSVQFKLPKYWKNLKNSSFIYPCSTFWSKITHLGLYWTVWNWFELFLGGLAPSATTQVGVKRLKDRQKRKNLEVKSGGGPKTIQRDRHQNLSTPVNFPVKVLKI